MPKNIAHILVDTLKSFENDKNTVVEEINWILNSDESFKIDKESFKSKIRELSILQGSIEQTEHFIQQIAQNGLDTESSNADSSDS